MKGKLTIGALARQGGVNVETIRYYQRRGLLHEPPKPRQGFRTYPTVSLQRVQFIKRAQGLGFTLEEIQGLLNLDESRACEETRRMAAQKLALIGRKISDLSKIKKALSGLLRACDSVATGAPCPIIHLLADH